MVGQDQLLNTPHTVRLAQLFTHFVNNTPNVKDYFHAKVYFS